MTGRAPGALAGRWAPMALAAALALAGGCGREVRGNRLDVLLVTIETTRADHLGAYGYARDTSPRLDALAKAGALFERASTVSPRTNPSLASLMTSLYPHQHGVRNLFLPLERSNLTLAEVLHGAGYRTIAVQTHPRLVKASGFAQGFDIYDDDVRTHPLADRACRDVEERIASAATGDRPWFLWLHLMDPHWTYDPPPPWRTRFGPEDPRPAALYRALDEHRASIGPVIFRNTMPPDEVAAFVNLYDGEIAFTDDAIGRLLDFLRTRGLASRTVVVVTADHGESLGEHDYFFEHGDFGTEPEVHVPLLLAAPGRVPAGVRVPWTVRSIDVAPTVLDLLQLPPEARFRGTSLLPLLRPDVRDGDRPCFGEIDQKLHPENTRREVEGVAGKWRWLRLGRFKLFYVPRSSGAIDLRLYDLDTDPGETRDVREAHPELSARMEKELRVWLAEDRGEERSYHISDEAREQLRSLGYTD